MKPGDLVRISDLVGMRFRGKIGIIVEREEIESYSPENPARFIYKVLVDSKCWKFLHKELCGAGETNETR
jgi:hypothetical protein